MLDFANNKFLKLIQTFTASVVKHVKECILYGSLKTVEEKVKLCNTTVYPRS
jgi:hypothetical protein